MSNDIRVPRDCDYRQACKWVTPAGAPVNLAGYTLVCNVKSYPPRATVNLSPSTSVTSAAAGEFDVVFTDVQTAAMVKDQYYWEVLATETATTFVHRILSGRILMADTGANPVLTALQTAVHA
jgi:hypothetical protein